MATVEDLAGLDLERVGKAPSVEGTEAEVETDGAETVGTAPSVEGTEAEVETEGAATEVELIV